MTATGDTPGEIDALPHSEILRGNLASVVRRIESAAQSVEIGSIEDRGRSTPELVAVTKTVPASVAQSLLDLGCTHLGENRAQAFKAKHEALRAPRPHWHFIGHLQRNKAKDVVERADVLHSVDSMRLARAAAQHAKERVENALVAYVEVNLTGEDEKHGFSEAEAVDAVELLADAPGIQLAGLMAMGPLSRRGTRGTEEVFADARDLASALSASHGAAFESGRCKLSMGMSGDFETAIRFGSDCVRVGSALFEGLEF